MRIPNLADQPTVAERPALNHDPEALDWALRRDGRNWTELAQEIPISKSYMSDIRNGRRSAPPRILNRIAQILNCPLGVLEAKRR